MKTYQMMDEVIKFDFVVEVKKRYIEGEDVENFEELLRKYYEFTRKKWVLNY